MPGYEYEYEYYDRLFLRAEIDAFIHSVSNLYSELQLGYARSVCALGTDGARSVNFQKVHASGHTELILIHTYMYTYIFIHKRMHTYIHTYKCVHDVYSIY